MIIAVDFDGTLCKNKFPGIGESNTVLIKQLIKFRNHSGNKLVLWTCRSTDYLIKAVAWCANQGLFFEAVNEDVEEIKVSDFGGDKSVKVFADIYIDDRSSGFKWGEICLLEGE